MTLPTDRPAWMDRAACTGLTQLFFSDHRGDHYTARRICNTRCHVVAECLAYTLEHEAGNEADIIGVAGGLLANHRRKILREQRLAEQPVRVSVQRNHCGTERGYYLHRRNAETACDTCKAAHALAKALRHEASA